MSDSTSNRGLGWGAGSYGLQPGQEEPSSSIPSSSGGVASGVHPGADFVDMSPAVLVSADQRYRPDSDSLPGILHLVLDKFIQQLNLIGVFIICCTE